MPVGPVPVPVTLRHIFGDDNPNAILNLPSIDYKKWLDTRRNSLQCGEKLALGVLRRTATKRQYAYKRSQESKNDMNILIFENRRLCRENDNLKTENAQLRADLEKLTPPEGQPHPHNVVYTVNPETNGPAHVGLSLSRILK